METEEGERNIAEEAEEHQLRIGDFILFRGTDGLIFNILKITKDYDPEIITPKTRINGDFIVPETENEGEDHVIFYHDPR